MDSTSETPPEVPDVVLTDEMRSGPASECDSCESCPPWPGPRIIWTPFLVLFTRSADLPLEIRHIIWRLTLPARAIEINYLSERGFYSNAIIPVALRVCHDSRVAVVINYPLCFGSGILAPANIVVNFSIDALVFEWGCENRIAQFLTGMSEYEIGYCQSIAVHNYISEPPPGDDGLILDDALDLFKKATNQMPAMAEFRVFYEIDEYYGIWNNHSTAHMELFEECTYDWKVNICCYYELEAAYDGPGDYKHVELPDSAHYSKGFTVPKFGSLWSWRP